MECDVVDGLMDWIGLDVNDDHLLSKIPNNLEWPQSAEVGRRRDKPALARIHTNHHHQRR